MAGVALGDIHLDITWQAWHKLTSTVVLRGRRGTHGTVWRAWSGFVAWGAAPLCVAGVALGDIHLRFTWQAWHLVTFTLISRGRRGTISHPRSFCVAGASLTLSPTIFDTPSFTHNFVTHTIFHTPLCHTPSFTHPLLHTIFVTHHL